MLLGVIVLILLTSTIGIVSGKEESVFTGEECECAALRDLGWSGGGSGMVIGYPRNELFCLYSKKTEDPCIGRPYWYPTVMELRIHHYSDVEKAARAFRPFKKDREEKETIVIVESEGTSSRFSHVMKIPVDKECSLYSGKRSFYHENWIVEISGNGLNFETDGEFINDFDALEECAKAVICSKQRDKSNPRLRLEQDTGPPDTEVDVFGDGFNADEEVEIKWDASDGNTLTRIQADRNGNFKTRITIPGTAQKGQHTVYAVSNKGVRAIANFNVDFISVYGSVKARLRGGLPLQGVEVRLSWKGPGGTIQDLGSSVTDEQGKYMIYSPALRVPMPGHLLLRVTLRESQFGTYTLFDATVDDTVVQALFGRYGEIGAKQGDISTWFTIDTSGDLEKNLWFEDLDDNSATKTIREDHALDAALIYYHTHQVMRFYRNLGAPFITTPVNVRIYSPIPTSCGGTIIDINADDSDWNSGDAPKNREWHEFSHYIMWDVYGAFPPRHYEAGNDFNGNDVIDEDVNHGGYWGNWLSSSDAITEGFAEFMAMVIADQMNRQGEIYMQDHIEPYIYTIGSPFPSMLNLEINYPQTLYPYVPAVFTGVSIPDEELCVASTLWDLYD
ncbi:hypothetical protein C5S36_14085, partial [Candidatus Methanophagaceae archaeon]